MCRVVRKTIRFFCLILILSGCAQRNLYDPAQEQMGALEQEQVAVEVVGLVERAEAAPDRSALAVTVAGEDAFRLPLAAGNPAAENQAAQNRALRAKEVQCLAAAHATLANLTDAETQLLACRPPRPRDKFQPLDLLQEMFAWRALDERNQAAGRALELFYRLAEAEAGSDYLESTWEQVRRTIGQIQQLRALGLELDMDQAAVRQREIALRHEQAELALSLQRLNGQLQLLIGMDPRDAILVRPMVDWDVIGEPLDREQEVARGLAQRPDLAILQLLLGTLDSGTLPVVEAVLEEQGVATAPTPTLERIFQQLMPGRAAGELAIRHGQLVELLVVGERRAAEEIRSAVAAVSARYQQIVLAQEALERHERRLDDLQRKREIGQVSPLEVSAARVERIEAQGELMRRIIDWKVAQVQLKQAQGGLVRECFP